MLKEHDEIVSVLDFPMALSDLDHKGELYGPGTN